MSYYNEAAPSKSLSRSLGIVILAWCLPSIVAQAIGIALYVRWADGLQSELVNLAIHGGLTMLLAAGAVLVLLRKNAGPRLLLIWSILTLLLGLYTSYVAYDFCRQDDTYTLYPLRQAIMRLFADKLLPAMLLILAFRIRRLRDEIERTAAKQPWTMPRGIAVAGVCMAASLIPLYVAELLSLLTVWYPSLTDRLPTILCQSQLILFSSERIDLFLGSAGFGIATILASALAVGSIQMLRYRESGKRLVRCWAVLLLVLTAASMVMTLLRSGLRRLPSDPEMLFTLWYRLTTSPPQIALSSLSLVLNIALPILALIYCRPGQDADRLG